MAKNEPNMPDNVKTEPANEMPAEEKAAPIGEPVAVGEPPAPELTAEEAAALGHEGEAALRDIGEEQLEPPPPFDIPIPGETVPEEQAVEKAAEEKKEPEAPAPEDKAPEKQAGRRGRPPKAGKADKEPKPPKPEKQPKAEKSAKPPKATTGKTAPAKEKAPAPEPEKPPEPREAPRNGEQEQIVFINLSELHAFKNHPFQVRNDDEMAAMVESVKDKGVTQPAIVRPREDGGYELVSGHRRHKASELAGFADMPVIVRNLTDEQAITQMVEDNTNQRENILPSERAKALKMQLEAIKQQGARTGNGERSNQVVAERNKMTVKQVQRYIKLNDLVPDLLKMADEKKIGFTPAVELAHIKPKNQRYIAVAIEGQQSAPSLSQSQRMRELDQKGLLQPDMIDGIMLEEKKEVDKLIISAQELGQYFGKDKTPREMKDQILKLLDDWAGKEKAMQSPEKKAEQEK